ncbi:Zinc finger CCHC domain-containing protein [Trichinella spiralis]|uniref:Zinc finger CCHC domain-containing protein n=1 Tax=Trichinella spiralis TaxID=6334 RepID=A0ABR3KZN6_TRISP
MACQRSLSQTMQYFLFLRNFKRLFVIDLEFDTSEQLFIIRKEFKEWSKENVKTRTARSRTREGKRYDE